MPTTAINTYNVDRVYPAINPSEARGSRYQVKPSVTIARGTIVGVVTASGKIAAYASGNSDGTQTPIGLTEWAVVTDSSGNITQGGGNLEGTTEDSTFVFTSGWFLAADLTGYDATAAGVLQAHANERNTNGDLMIRIP